MRCPGVCGGLGARRLPAARQRVSPAAWQEPASTGRLFERPPGGGRCTGTTEGAGEWAQCPLGAGGQTVSTSPPVCCSEWGLCRDRACGFPEGTKAADVGRAAVQLGGEHDSQTREREPRMLRVLWSQVSKQDGRGGRRSGEPDVSRGRAGRPVLGVTGLPVLKLGADCSFWTLSPRCLSRCFMVSSIYMSLGNPTRRSWGAHLCGPGSRRSSGLGHVQVLLTVSR